MKAQGDSSSQNATTQRLIAQLNGKQNDIELLTQQRAKLQEEMNQQRTLVTESDKRFQDLYHQLVQTKQNLDILTNEQQILSQELTLKQNELLKAQKELTNNERELIALKPLKEQFSQLTASQQKQIEDITKAEFERNKLTQKVRDLEAQLSLSKQDTLVLATNYKQLVAEKNALMQQLSQFEKDSFEIQTKVRRGIDLSKESEKVERTVSELRERERELVRQLEQL